MLIVGELEGFTVKADSLNKTKRPHCSTLYMLPKVLNIGHCVSLQVNEYVAPCLKIAPINLHGYK